MEQRFILILAVKKDATTMPRKEEFVGNMEQS